MHSTMESFGEANFGKAQLGDVRRSRRLAKTADLMCRRPGGSLPQKLNAPKDLKAFYRLVSHDKVTHQAILESHREATQKKIDEINGPVLVLHDATELDYTTHYSLENNLGQIGNGNRCGYITQNSLVVDPENRNVLGLYNQVLHHRVNVSGKETLVQKRKRESRESLLWLKGTEPLPSSSKLVDVCDQGADTFEFLEHEVHSGRRFVIRASHDREIILGHDVSDETVGEKETGQLRMHARELPEAGNWELSVTSKVEKKSSSKKRSPKKRSPKKSKKKGRKQKVKRAARVARTANMAVSFAAVQIKSPAKKTGNHGNTPLRVWVIRVWEVNSPEGQERLEWFLITNEPVLSFEDAYRVVGWYECRWIVEEYHKGMKTGCKIESPQFTCENRLQPVIALLSIVTLTLLSMRDASRRSDAKERRATEIICEDYVAMLSAWRHGSIKNDWSIHDFYYALARLGGHQNRRGDHPPGWQTIWNGWKDLQAMICGFDSMKKCG